MKIQTISELKRIGCALFALMCVLAVSSLSQAATALDNNGWTTFTPSADTRIIYVSSSTGNDANNGLSANAPLKSLSKGVSLLRNGYPDWLMLKKGDTWTNEILGTFALSGRSSSEPMLVSSYGRGARPKIEMAAATAGQVLYAPNGVGDYLAIVGLEFYCYDRNPNDSRFVSGSATLKPSGLAFYNAPSWLLLEDNKVSFFANGVIFQPADGNPTIQAGLKSLNLQVRRNVIVDQYGGMGIFLDGFESATLTENLLDHNGWNNTVGGDAARGSNAANFSHNLYETGQHGSDITSYINGPVTMTGNIMTRDATGAHMRSGGNLNNNLWASNCSIFDFGRPRTDVSYSITNDVYLEFVDQPGVPVNTSTDGWGINGFQKFYVNDLNYAVNTVKISNNIFANFLVTNPHGFAVLIDQWSGFPTPQPFYVTNNIIYMASYNTVGGAFQDNSLGTSGSVLTPNQIYFGPSNSWNTVDPSIYPNPTRSIGSYAGTLGLPATLDGFLTAARDQSKDNWNPALMAAAVNDYIRAGFGITPGTSDTTPPSVPTGLTATPVSDTQVNLSWIASTDNVGVTGYKVFRNGAQVGTSSNTSYQDTGLSTGTAYTYTVSAYDAAGNTSAKSSSVSFTTPAPTPAPAPSVTINSPANGSTPNGSINIAVSASSAIGIASITITGDGNSLATCTNVTSCSTTWQKKKLTKGTHTVGGIAVDTNGSPANASVTVVVLK